MRTFVVSGPKQALAALQILVICAFAPLLAASSSPEMGRLNQAVILKLGYRQVSLPAGLQVEVLRKSETTTVVSFELKGVPVITQITSGQLDLLPPSEPQSRASAGPALTAASTNPVSSPPVAEIIADAPSSAMTIPNRQDESEMLPDIRTTLSATDTALPEARFTALNGSFYVVIRGAPIRVVYSLPMEGNHLAPSASNLVFYGPFPDEETDLTGNIVPDLVTKLGCLVFSFSFKANDEDLSRSETAYWSKQSTWFQAVMDARAEIMKGFGLKKQKLLLMGYSGGGGMVLNLAGAFPGEVDAVAAQGANLAPELSSPNSIKWLIINNRGESNAEVTKPFYGRLKQMGSQALYCETTPSRARGSYHAPSQEAYNLIYTFLAGMLEQQKRADSGRTAIAEQWPYAAPIDPLKRYHVVRSNILESDSLQSGKFDLLPSAAFALNWSDVCPPIQTVTLAGEGKLHVNFPASSKPKGVVIYYDNPENFHEFSREIEDICALAEAGSVVVSPMYQMPPEKFAQIASDWIPSQTRLQSLPVHLAAYGKSGIRFLSAMNDVRKLSFKSVNLIGPADIELEPAIKDNIESLAKDSGLYSFLVCRNRPAFAPASLSGLAQDLVDDQSRARGCQEIVVNADLDDEDVKATVYQQALSTIVQMVNDYSGNITVASPDLWIDPPSISDQPDAYALDASKPDATKPYIVNRKIYITVDVHDRGIYGQKSTIELKSLGTVLAKKDLSFDYDGDQKITLSYVPAEASKVDSEIVLLPLPEEISKDNNQVDVKLTVEKGTPSTWEQN